MSVRLPVPMVRRIGEARDVGQAAGAHQWLRRLALDVEPGALRARALVELAQMDSPTRLRDLGAILADEASPLPLRHLAATLLGRCDHDAARRALLDGLATPDPRLAGRIAQSLGRIGDRGAFKPVARVAKSLTGVALHQARFALRLIAHRWGLDLHDRSTKVAFVGMAPDEGRPFRLRKASPEEALVALRCLDSEPFGVSLEETSAQTIVCGRRPSVLFLNRELGTPPDVQRLLEKRAFVGLVARCSEETDRFSAWLLVLSTPRGKRGLALSAYRPDGTLVLAGTASRDHEDLAFALDSVVRRAAFAARIAGKLAGSALTLSTARAGRLLHDVGHPTRDRFTSSGTP